MVLCVAFRCLIYLKAFCVEIRCLFCLLLLCCIQVSRLTVLCVVFRLLVHLLVICCIQVTCLSDYSVLLCLVNQTALCVAFRCLFDSQLTGSSSQFLPRSQDDKLQFELEAFRFQQDNSGVV